MNGILAKVRGVNITKMSLTDVAELFDGATRIDEEGRKAKLDGLEFVKVRVNPQEIAGTNVSVRKFQGCSLFVEKKSGGGMLYQASLDTDSHGNATSSTAIFKADKRKGFCECLIPDTAHNRKIFTIIAGQDKSGFLQIVDTTLREKWMEAGKKILESKDEITKFVDEEALRQAEESNAELMESIKDKFKASYRLSPQYQEVIMPLYTSKLKEFKQGSIDDKDFIENLKEYRNKIDAENLAIDKAKEKADAAAAKKAAEKAGA